MAEFTLTFNGGAQHVTGAQFLLAAKDNSVKILIDCGMEQGEKFSSETNAKPFTFDPKTIDAVVITHAHADHIALIPKLVKDGYTGPIYMTAPTRDLAKPMLEDSQQIMAQEATHHGLPILYDRNDIEAALAHIQPLAYGEEKKLPGGLTLVLHNAGHILGASMVELRKEKKIIFTGDVGPKPAALVKDNETLADVDYLVMESVYGDRKHQGRETRVKDLAAAVTETAGKKGTLLIPSFSLERTQIILRDLADLIRAGTVSEMPVFLDSPLAIKVTKIYEQYPEYLNDETRADIAKSGGMFNFPMLRKTESSEDSESIDHVPGPKIIIAGAGMSHGGRIRKHEKDYLPDPKTTLLIVGYQVPGSLGRRLQEGAKSIDIDHKEIKVRASVRTISGYSAHKDSDQLVDLVEPIAQSVQKVFVTMGEPKASTFLAQRLHNELGVTAIVPSAGNTATFDL